MQQLIGIRRVLFSTTSAGDVGVETPRGLYKYLLRQCNRLPNEEIQKYYRHQVRQVREDYWLGMVGSVWNSRWIYLIKQLWN